MKHSYYDRVWEEKLALPRYSTLEVRWRSRWDFALQHTPKGAQVVDAGCGDGVLGELLIQRLGCTVVGLDISTRALELALGRGVETYACDISNETFPQPDNCCDVVTMLCCLEHIFDPAHALREAARILRPEGQILVTLPNAVHYRNRLSMLRGRLSEELLHTRDGEGLHIRFFDSGRDLARLLHENIPDLTISKYLYTLKNPRSHKDRWVNLKRLLARAWPNLGAEYVHYVIGKK